ncbi:MAG: MaoC family dehydratase N-terminal domain-containing protein [Actinobacteria bacterium]|jgi:acyl dehydratase|nr:MaoC family dehydratase N-terminal domain-containing protein [Actinomycetota bacterium]
MPINHDVVGAEGAPIVHSWTSKDALLYAVGVGAGIDELAFTTENSHDVPQRVLPTMAAVIGAGVSGAISAIGSFDFAMLVHGEQSFVQHREIPVEGSLTATGKIIGIYDKGSGAVVAVEGECVDNATGEPLLTVGSAIFIRGEGGWGGDRGPSGDRNAAPDRSADASVSYRVRPDQALTYRLSGDRNPLHSDPWFAALAGFDRPILHGLCTYGFTGRALLHAMCDSDPAKFRSMEGRFASPVFPGEELTIEMWNEGAGECIFQTRGEDGRVVLVGGRHTFDA